MNLGGTVAPNHRVLERRAIELYINHAFPGRFHGLLDCHRHLTRLTGSVTDTALAVSDHGQSGKPELAAALDYLGDAINGHQLFEKLVAFRLRIVIRHLLSP